MTQYQLYIYSTYWFFGAWMGFLTPGTLIPLLTHPVLGEFTKSNLGISTKSHEATHVTCCGKVGPRRNSCSFLFIHDDWWVSTLFLLPSLYMRQFHIPIH